MATLLRINQRRDGQVSQIDFEYSRICVVIIYSMFKNDLRHVPVFFCEKKEGTNYCTAQCPQNPC